MYFFRQLFDKIGLFLFFIALLLLATFMLYTQSDFHKNALGRKAMKTQGYFAEKASFVQHFWNLPETNEALAKENAALKNQLQTLQQPIVFDSSYTVIPSESPELKYKHHAARVIDRDLRKRNNFFLLNKGAKDSLKPNMAVVTSNGLVGEVLNTTDNYASVLSVLHSKTKIKAKVKGMEYFGLLVWNEEDYRYLSLREIPKYLNISVGDTVVTAGASSIYPEGILVGKIEKLTPNDQIGEFDIDVRLFEDLSKTQEVYVIDYTEKEEIEQVKELENELFE